MRLARTVAVAVVLLLVLWQCTGSDDPAPSKSATKISAPTPTSALVAAPVAMTATAAMSPAKLPAARSLVAATLLGDQIFIAGGLNDKRSSTDTVWSLDLGTKKVNEAGKLPAPLHAAAAAPLGNIALIMGGAKGDTAFDTVTAVNPDATLSKQGALPQGRTNATAIAGTDGVSTFLIGGFDGSKPTNDVLRTTDGGAFQVITTLTQPHRFPAVAMLGQSIWVIGGEFDKQLSSSIQRVDVGAPGVPSTVTDGPPLPVALSRASAFVLGGSIFIAGGRTAQGRSDQIYRLDPVTGGVTSAGVLPAPWSDAAVVVSGSTAYLIGGINARADEKGTLVAKPTTEIVSIIANV